MATHRPTFDDTELALTVAAVKTALDAGEWRLLNTYQRLQQMLYKSQMKTSLQQYGGVVTPAALGAPSVVEQTVLEPTSSLTEQQELDLLGSMIERGIQLNEQQAKRQAELFAKLVTKQPILTVEEFQKLEQVTPKASETDEKPSFDFGASMFPGKKQGGIS